MSDIYIKERCLVSPPETPSLSSDASSPEVTWRYYAKDLCFL